MQSVILYPGVFPLQAKIYDFTKYIQWYLIATHVLMEHLKIITVLSLIASMVTFTASP